MKKPTRTTMPQWWLLLLSTFLASLLLLLFLSFTATTKLIPASLTAGDGGSGDGGGGFAGHPPRPPRLAYLISGSKGSSQQLRRVLRAVYHPLNVYLLHLDREVPEVEREELARFVRSEAAFVRFDNVRVVGNADLVTYKGPTMVASTLHAVAILLKLGKPWDWFINLSSSDYPLMPQDGWFLATKLLI